MIISRTPYRVSLFGGGSDYKSWYQENGGKVIAGSINKYCFISFSEIPTLKSIKYKISYSKIEYAKKISEIKNKVIRKALEFKKISNALEIHYHGELFSKSGVGSSSCFVVGLLNVLNHYKNNRNINNIKLAKESIFFEQEILKECVGDQDQIISTYGGFNEVLFSKNKFKVNRIISNEKSLKELSKNYLLVYSGIQRFSYRIASNYVNNLNRNKKVFLNNLMGMYIDAKNSILKGDVITFSKILNESWMLKKELDKSVTNNRLDNLYEYFIKNGALGCKLMGAGGGGFFLVCLKSEDKENFKKKLKNLLYYDFEFQNSGSKIIYSE